MKRNLIYAIGIVILSVTMSSCKKDRLKGEMEILVGEWEWVGSEIEYPGGSGSPSATGYKTPDQISTTYRIKFYKKGRMEIFQNGTEIYGKRTIMQSWNENSTGYNVSIAFTITNLTGGRNEEHIDFGGKFKDDSNDTLYMRTIPFSEYETAHSGGNANYNKLVRQ
jgi:hypothetical protein